MNKIFQTPSSSDLGWSLPRAEAWAQWVLQVVVRSPVARLAWSTAEEDFAQDGKEKRRLERNWLDGLTAPNPRWLLPFTLSGLKGSKITHVHQTEYSHGYLGWRPGKWRKQINTESTQCDTNDRPFIFCCLKELMETINNWWACVHEVGGEVCLWEEKHC